MKNGEIKKTESLSKSNLDLLDEKAGFTTYFVDELIYDIVNTWFEYDNYPFLLKYYLRYAENVTFITVRVQSVFIKSIVRKFKNKNQITYMFDLCYLLWDIAYYSIILTENVVKFANIMKRIVRAPPKINVFWNWYNPLRLWVQIINVIRLFNTSVHTLEKQLQDLEDDIIEITIAIVSDVEVPGVLRYWLYDKMDDEMDDERKVIDYLAHFNLLSILSVPNIARTVEQIWRGIYDSSKTVNLTSTLTRGVIAKTLRGFYIPADKFFTTIGGKSTGSSVYYTFKTLINILKSSKIKNTTESILFENTEKIKLPTYGFVAYTDSIYLQFFIDTVLLVLFTLLTYIVILYEVNARKKMEDTYSAITTLQGQTQTTSVLASIESNYADLQSYGETWLSRFKFMIVLYTYGISMFIMDLMVVLTYIVRGISIKMLSPNFMLVISADIVHWVFAIYFVIAYFSKYNINRTLVRSEEKYYRMMLSTYDDSIGTPVMYNYYLWLLAARILYQFVYFSSFAVLVQIIIKMMLNAVKFLFICLIFIVVFTILANVLFYDISNYSTFYVSLVSTYSNGLGGFDFSSFDASTHISYYSKKVLLAAYLLITVVMLMNFLIAILSETYSTYYGQTLALQMKEIIKLRAIYEPNPYYSCLVKAPFFFNAYIILLAPFVVGFKSKRLNKVVLFFEHSIVIILFIIWISVMTIILYPIVCLLFLMQKIIFMNRYAIRPSDYFIRIIDLFASALVLPVLLSVIWIAHVVGETLHLYQTHIVKNVEVYKDEYLYINKIMDVTLSEHDEKLYNHSLCSFENIIGVI